MSSLLAETGRRLRGVRSRLVIAFVVAAALAGAAGVVVFSVLLEGAVHSNVDAELRTTAAAFAGDIRSGTVDRNDAVPRIDPRRAHRPLAAIVALYGPAGTLIDTEPSALPSTPPGAPNTLSAAGWRSGRIRTARYDDKSIRVIREEVAGPGGTWVVVVGQNLATSTDATRDAQHVLLAIAPIAVVLAGIGAWLLSGAALRPVDRMRADAQRLSETDEPGVISVPNSSDSLAKLARTFNVLLDRLHVSLEQQRNLVADAGHELRTPLAVLRTELQTALRPGRTRDDLADSIAHAQQETARLEMLSEGLLLLAQPDGHRGLVHREVIDVVDVLGDVTVAHRARFAAAEVRLSASVSTAGPAMAELDPVALRRILDNLLANALRHTGSGGEVRIGLRAEPDAAEIVLDVTDSGDGFEVEFLPRAFERFTRSDRSRNRSSEGSGSGLGLAIVATLVAALGGQVRAENVAEGGARVTVVLPVPPDARISAQ